LTWRNTRKTGIKAKKTKFNGITFDSEYESKVYIELMKRYGSDKITPHFPLSIKPATEVFKELNWAVDFKIEHVQEVFYYEAKGLLTEEFRLKIQLLEWRQPEAYKRLFIVCPNNLRLRISRKLKLPIDRVMTKQEIYFHAPTVLGKQVYGKTKKHS